MKICCIEGCKSKKDVMLFEFPTSRLLRKRWLDAINPALKLPSDALVCLRHFASSDYEDVRGKIRLRGRVLPTLFGEQAVSPKPLKDPLDLPNEESQENMDKEPSSDNHNGNVDNDNGKVDNDNGKVDNDNEKVDNVNNEIDPSSTSKDVTENGSNNNSDFEKALNISTTENGHNEKTDNHSENIDNGIVDNHNEKVDNDNGKVDNDNQKADNDNAAGIKRVKDKVGRKVKKKWVPMRQRLNGHDSDSEDSVNSDLPPPPILEDLEEHLPNYQIANMKTERQVAAMTETVDPEPEEEEIEEMVVEPHVPVFIELSVGQDTSPHPAGQANDCLMVLESVQCEVDPALLLEARAEDDDCCEQIDLDDDDDDVILNTSTEKPSADPISLLTSSDEDDVILQEPHIDTLSVSDETDEDDLPLQKLIKKEKKEKKLKKKKKMKTEAIQSILVGVSDFYCYHCQHVSTCRSAHEKHVKTHLKDIDSEQSQGTTRVYQVCKECGFTTSSKSQMHRHQRKHLNEKRYKCPLCSYRSKYNMSLMYHLKTHDFDPNMYNCGACGLELHSKKALLKHQETCYELRAKFDCDQCKYKASSKSNLKNHKNTLHK